jgi:hypothetical protein
MRIAPTLAPAQVQAQQHRRPIGRVIAARAGVDLQKGAGRIVLAGQKRLNFETVQRCSNVAHFGGDFVLKRRWIVLRERHLRHHPRIVQTRSNLHPRIDCVADLVQLLHLFLGAIRVVPEPRLRRLGFETGYFFLLTGQVKDDPSEPRTVSAGHPSREASLPAN